jgi:hypothetical protein
MAQIDLSWTAPDSGTGGSPDTYEIYRASGTKNAGEIFNSGSPSTNKIADVAYGTNSYDDQSVSYGTTYSYTVVTKNAAGYGPAATAATAKA